MAGVTFSSQVPITSSRLETSTTGDKHVFVIPFKCQLRESYVYIDTAATHATNFVVKFDIIDGATRGDGDGGTFTKQAGDQQGKFMVKRFTSANTQLTRGSAVCVEVTTANGATCNILAGITVEQIGEVSGDDADVTTTGVA